MHEGPLWQFFLAAFFLLFVVERAAITVMQSLSHVDGPVDGPAHVWLAVAYALQALIGAVVAVGIWRGRRWSLPPLIVLGAVVAATAAIQAFVLDLLPVSAALGQIGFVALVTGGLYALLNHELREGETNAARAERSRHDPADRSRDAAKRRRQAEQQESGSQQPDPR